MAKITIVLLLAASALFSHVVAEPQQDAVIKAKLKLIGKEIAEVPEAIRNITIRTPQCHVQLSSMVTDFITGFDLVKYTLNNIIPNTVGLEGHDLIIRQTTQISKFNSNLQNALGKNAEELKELFASEIVNIKNEASHFLQNFNVPNEFVENQLKRTIDIFIFMLYKVKYQTLLFEKTNKDLVSAISVRVSDFNNAIKSLSPTDKTTELEIRHAMHHLASILERSIYKLENWAEVNSNSADNIKVVQEASHVFSESFDKLIRAANSDNRTPQLKNQLIRIVENIVKNVIKLGQIDYPDNLGGQEFIRSGLFDIVTFGKAYGDNIQAVLSQ